MVCLLRRSTILILNLLITPFAGVLALSLLILSIYFSVRMSASVLISLSFYSEFRPRDALKGICLSYARVCTWIARYLKETVL